MADERVLVEGTPERGRLMRYLMTNAAIVCVLTGIGILALPIVWLVLRAYVKKHGYWVTNKRVIVTNGIIGFRTRSIPLERVSDVAISANFLEKWMGLRSVIVRDMTGEAMSGATMLASPDASGLQHRVLDEVHAANRHPEGKTPALPARPYRDVDADQQASEMLELLRRIESNTRER